MVGCATNVRGTRRDMKSVVSPLGLEHIRAQRQVPRKLSGRCDRRTLAVWLTVPFYLVWYNIGFLGAYQTQKGGIK